MKKRSIGVTIFGVLFIIGAFTSFITTPRYQYLGVIWLLYGRLLGILSLILAFYLFKLREWARKGIIFYVIATTLIAMILFPKAVGYNLSGDPDIEKMRIPLIIAGNIIYILWIIVVAFFFTRPDVRKQFKEE